MVAHRSGEARCGEGKSLPPETAHVAVVRAAPHWRRRVHGSRCLNRRAARLSTATVAASSAAAAAAAAATAARSAAARAATVVRATDGHLHLTASLTPSIGRSSGVE